MSNNQKFQFFNDLAIEMNCLSADDAQRFYYCFLKFVIKRCKKEGKIELPEWGEFKLSVFKERPVDIVVNGRRIGERRILPPTKALKFKENRKLREYLNQK